MFAATNYVWYTAGLNGAVVSAVNTTNATRDVSGMPAGTICIDTQPELSHYPINVFGAYAGNIQPAGAAVDFTRQNVSTPNADGLIDESRPVRQALPGGRLRVCSRWGTLVYQPAALRWDGTGAASGEYGYPLDCPDCRGTLRQQRGSLTLAGALKNGTPPPGLFPALVPDRPGGGQSSVNRRLTFPSFADDVVSMPWKSGAHGVWAPGNIPCLTERLGSAPVRLLPAQGHLRYLENWPAILEEMAGLLNGE